MVQPWGTRAEAELSFQLHSAEVNGIVWIQAAGAIRAIWPDSSVKIEYVLFLPQNLPNYPLL